MTLALAEAERNTKTAVGNKVNNKAKAQGKALCFCFFADSF